MKKPPPEYQTWPHHTKAQWHADEAVRYSRIAHRAFVVCIIAGTLSVAFAVLALVLTVVTP